MKILVAGDYCPRYRVARSIEGLESNSILSDAIDLTKAADYSIVNLECPIVNDNAPQIEKLGPGLKCSQKGLSVLIDAGFDCVCLANNHFYDYGNQGVVETIKTLKAQNVDYVGGGENIAEASKVLYKEINGIKLAIVNCCEHEFSIATDKQAGSNPLNPVQQWYAIQEARKKADKTLIIVHGGHEHFQLPSPRMVETYRFFIDAGADAVVNHHQHCYSGYEIYQGKPIFYGLGNFCFDHPQKHSGIWTEGYMVTLDFTDDTPSFKIHPYKQCTETPRIQMLAEDAFDIKIDELNRIIANPIELQSAIDNYYQECENTYCNVFEPLRSRWYIAAKRRGWLPSFVVKKRKIAAFNYINCESHRDKMLFWLKK